METAVAPVLIGKSLWGVQEAGNPGEWDNLFSRIKEEGYSAVETIMVFDLNKDPVRFKNLLKANDLKLVIQLHTASDWALFDYCTSCDITTHVESFRKLLGEAVQHNPAVINVHSGHDSWDTDMAVQYFTQVLEIEKELVGATNKDILVVHETHRQRLLSNPYSTRAILKRPEMSLLKINCDLSHWVCVCEKTFNSDYDARDKWWPEVLAMVADRCYLIHLRFGHPQGPQIPDLNDDFYANDINAHLSWWKQILDVQQKRISSGSGDSRQKWCLCMTEHGPEPYQIFPDRSISEYEKNSLLWGYNSRVKLLVEDFLGKP